MRIGKTAPALTTGALLLLLGAHPIRAQQGQVIPPRIPRSVAPAGQIGTSDPSANDPFGQRTDATTLPTTPPHAVTRLPYANWTAHTGVAPECVALLRIGGPNGPLSTGLVIRCDGFILVSTTVVAAHRAGASIVVNVTGAENEEITEPVPVTGRLHYMSARCPFGVLKVNDHHLRSLPLLDAKAVKPGVPVILVTAQAAERPGVCTGVQKDAVVGERAKGVADHADDDSYLLHQVTEEVPVGTVVVDAESGAAVGMVTIGGVKPVFSTFATLYDVCNEVGIAPDREAIKERKTASVAPPKVTSTTERAARQNETVWIPGGSVQLDGELEDYYRKAFKTDIACTPGFFIDTHLVTREEYETWARQVGLFVDGHAHDRPDSPKVYAAVPLAFADYSDRAELMKRMPVSVRFSWDAERYAAEHGKRLPTEIEWRRATLCDDVRWAVSLNETYEGQLRTLYRMVLQHKTTWLAILTTPRATPSRNSSSARNGQSVPPGATTQTYNSMTPAEVTALLTTNAAQDQLFTRALQGVTGGITQTLFDSFPWVVIPVGWRDNDRSIYGIQDVLMNIPEHVLPIGRGTKAAPKLFAAKSDLFDTFVYDRSAASVDPIQAMQQLIATPLRAHSVLDILGDTSGGTNGPGPLAATPSFLSDQIGLGTYVFALFALRGISLSDYWFAADASLAAPTFLAMELRTKPFVGIGFRGAR